MLGQHKFCQGKQVVESSGGRAGGGQKHRGNGRYITKLMSCIYPQPLFFFFFNLIETQTSSNPSLYSPILQLSNLLIS